MFAKLLKYEFKKSRKVLGTLTLVMLGLALLMTILVKYSVKFSAGGGEISDLVAGLLAPTIALSVLGLIGYSVCGFLIPLVQFYKSNFTDEGYLTFTLPANTHQIYLASLTNMLIWELLTTLTILLSILMVVFLGTSPDKLFNTDIITGIRELTADPLYAMALDEISTLMGWNAVDSVAYIAQLIIAIPSALVLATTAVVLGSTLAKKHKVWASIGLYVGMSWGINAITSTITMGTAVGEALSMTTEAEISAYMDKVMTTSTITGLVINLVILVGGYMLSTYLMRRKLNLP